MVFTWSEEQLNIFKEMQEPTSEIVLVLSTAGSSKSSSLVEGVNRLIKSKPNTKIQYLVFGTLAAKEAKAEFGSNAEVTTLHAMAHKYTVQPYGLGTVRSFITWRDIPKSIKRPFGIDYALTQELDTYCLSQYTSLDNYLQEQREVNDDWDYRLERPLKDMLNAMSRGEMPVTHSFYLKLFHIMVMKGKIVLPSVDRLLVDEFQDLSAVTLDIITKINATQKIFVGDPNQRCFDFLNLEDGFKRYPEGKIMRLSKSFRVDKSYAPRIQDFLRKYLEKDAVFEGMEYPDNPIIESRGYLARNNNSLITKMIELNEAGTSYHLATKTKVKQMFALPLFLIYAAPGKLEKNSELKHLQKDLDKYGQLPANVQATTSKYKYLLQVNDEDPKLKSAIAMISKFGSDAIIEASKQAVLHQKTKCNLSLMTIHTSKGTTKDSIELDDDVNKIMQKMQGKRINSLTETERAEMSLLFIAVTRHRYELLNCNFL